MTDNHGHSDTLALVRDLAEAVSTQARVANRAWLVMMAVALIVLIPRPTQAPTDPRLDLPFNLGAVDPSSFFLVTYAMLAVLSIGFCAAHAQQVRAAKLAQRALDSLAKQGGWPFDLHPRDLFDMFRHPSVSRVAPLAQLLRGKYQFYTESAID